MKIAVNPSGNIEGLQVLRAVAALMVVLHHARLSVPGSDGWPSFGEAGVDIFFVISGFVMAYTTTSFSDDAPMQGRLRGAGMFLRRRVIRVVPLYWLALLWTSRRALLHGQYSTDLVKDFFFIPHPNGVFHTWLAPTLQQGWTLNYEAFFYLLFGAAILFGSRRMLVLLAALLGCVLVAYGLSAAGWPADPDSAAGIARRFYGDSIILEFGYGVLLQQWMATRRAPSWPRWVFWLVAALGLAAVALGHGLGLRGVIEGLPATLIVWASIQACAGRRMPIFELLGAASYSIYLFHWASFGGVKPLAGALSSMPDGQAKVALLMGAHFAIALLAGLVIHVLIEKPFTRWATRKFGGRAHRVPAVLSA